MTLVEFLSFAFIQRAILAGVLIAVVTSVLGVFLVLKRLSLIGDSLSHIALSGVALGLVTNTAPVFMAMPVVMGGSLLVFKITKHAKIYTDAALGIVSAAGISGGIIIAALAGGFNVDLLAFLFGSILTVTSAELALAVVLAACILGVVYIFYNDLIAIAFDRNFAETAGINTDRIDTILILISSAAVVIALKVVGIMLVSAMIIIPPCAALQIASNFKHTLIYACLFSVGAVLAGIYLSFMLNLPCGAVIIVINILILAFCAGIKKYASKKRESAKIN